MQFQTIKSHQDRDYLSFVYAFGPFLTVASVLLVHLANFALRPQDYFDAPPSISRAIVHDDLGALFGLAMVPTALGILVLVSHMVFTGWRIAENRLTVRLPLLMVGASGLVGVVGMIMLSQFRTAEVQHLHDFGSYLLFLGFCITIVSYGLFLKFSNIDRTEPYAVLLQDARKNAWLILGAALVYGLIYFGGRSLPSQWFFTKRAVLAIWEVCVLSGYVWYIWRLGPLARAVKEQQAIKNASRNKPLNAKLVLGLLQFLWRHVPPGSKSILIALALVAGLTRDVVMVVVNEAAGGTREQAIQLWLPLFSICLVVFVGTSYYYQVLSTSVTTSVVNKVRLRLSAKIIHAQPSVIAPYERGALYHNMTTDVATVARTTTTILGLLPVSIFLLVAIPQLFYYSPVAGGLAVLVMIGGILAYVIGQQRMASLGLDARRYQVAYFEAIAELLDGHRELRLHHGRRSDFANALGNVLERLRGALVEVAKMYETSEAIVSVMKFSLFGGIVFLVPILFETDPTTIFSVLLLVLYCVTPFEQMVSTYPSIIGSLVSYLRIEELDKALPEVPTPTLRPIPVPFTGMSLRQMVATHRVDGNVRFTLGPIDLDIAKGEIIFLAGHNGSGKTTLLHVLAGLLDHDSGEFTIGADGQTTLSSHRENVTAIFSNYHIFKAHFGLSHVSDADASEAISRVGLSEHTQIADGAITRLELSSGQKRRLALAVAFMEDCDVLILDEFVADQDPGQREIFFTKWLPELKAAGKTVILATHDMSWFDYCDRLVRMDKGRIVDITEPRLKNPSLTANLP